MKIEMGESLGASWMKHEKSCDIVQTNWKASPEVKWENIDKVQDILNELKSEFGKDSQDIFGNGSAAQIVRQTECDVLGINFLPDGSAEVNALEVAIHLKGVGLHYSGIKKGNPNKTVNVSDDKVVAKMFWIAMTLFSSMGKTKGEISFASPIVCCDLLARINSRLEILKKVLNKHGFEFSFVVYANQDFYTKILLRVLTLVDSVADTNELFLRAMQIYLASAKRWAPEFQEAEASGDDNSIDAVPGTDSPKPHVKTQKYNVVVNERVYSADNSMGAAARDVVRAYVEYVQDVTFERLCEVFPRRAHGTCNVVVIETEDIDRRRFSMPIRLGDGTSVLVTNQWCGAGPHENWRHFCRHVENLDHEGLSILITLADGRDIV